MNNILKRALYESIMKNVSKQVKKILNEGNNDFHMTSGGDISVTADSSLRALNDYLKSIRYEEELSYEDEQELINTIVTSDNNRLVLKAKDKIVKSYLKLVISIAKRYKNAKKLSIEDLIQAGNEGLIEAVNHIDPKKLKNIRFSAYAVWYIRRSIMQLIDDFGYDNKVPQDIATIIRVASKFKEKFYTKEQRYPTTEEIYNGIKNKVKASYNKIKLALESGSYSDTSTDDVAFKDDNGDTVSVGDRTESTTFKSPGENMEQLENEKQLELLLIHLLGERNGTIMLDTFGINARRQKNPWELAEEWGITQTMVNQIIRNSKDKLFKSEKFKKLYLQN